MSFGQEILRFLPHPRIVAIDNKQKELNSITEGLFSLGLPCIPLLYSIDTGLKKPERLESSRLRIVFLDLNLKEFEHAGLSESTLVDPVAEVLETLSPAGPYLIAFWTMHEGRVGDVMRLLAERNKNIQLPVKYVVIDKTPFLNEEGAVHDLDALRKAIMPALEKDMVFLAMQAWESEVEGAAVRTFNMLHKLVTNIQADGTCVNDTDLMDILKNIAVAAWGKGQAKINPGGAATSGLAPILLDHLDRIIADRSYSSIWKAALKNGWNRPLPGCAPPPILNSHCLVDLGSKELAGRGAWLEFSDTALRRKKKIWENFFGGTTDHLREEFINPGTGKGSNIIRDSVRLGLLECTAACDYVNNKAPLLRYMLCARIPSALERNISWENPDRKTKHDAIHKLETIHVNDEDYILYLNFKYVLSLPVGNDLLSPEIVTPTFRVRSQLLADIGARYGAHTTRLGTFSFKTSPRS